MSIKKNKYKSIHKANKNDFPMKFEFEDKDYILKATKKGKLVLNKDENNSQNIDNEKK